MVTKEKARTRTSGLSLTPSLPVGQVTPPEPSDAPVITIGGHTYEEVEVMQNKVGSGSFRSKDFRSRPFLLNLYLDVSSFV